MLKIIVSIVSILVLNSVLYYIDLESYISITTSLILYTLLFFWLQTPKIDFNLKKKLLKLYLYSFFIVLSVILLIILDYSLNISLNILVFNQLPTFSRTDISLLNALYLFLLIPISEEIIFRGKIQKYFESKINYNGAIIITSSLFTLIHIFSGSGLIFILASSIFLGYVYFKTNNIFLIIIIHSLYNITTFYISSFDFLETFGEDYNLFLILSIIGIIVSLLGLVGLIRFRDRIYNFLVRFFSELFLNPNL